MVYSGDEGTGCESGGGDGLKTVVVMVVMWFDRVDDGGCGAGAGGEDSDIRGLFLFLFFFVFS